MQYVARWAYTAQRMFTSLSKQKKNMEKFVFSCLAYLQLDIWEAGFLILSLLLSHYKFLCSQKIAYYFLVILGTYNLFFFN